VISSEECIFFLNQILVIEGCYNRDTMTFECKHVYTGFLILLIFVLKEIIETIIQEETLQSGMTTTNEGKYISLMIAGGPFMPQNSFDLSPLSNKLLMKLVKKDLDEFLNRVMETKPNLVILLGPFLDQNNEDVKSGELKLGNSDTYLDYYHAFELIINFINDKIKTLPVKLLTFFFLFQIEYLCYYYSFFIRRSPFLPISSTAFL